MLPWLEDLLLCSESITHHADAGVGRRTRYGPSIMALQGLLASQAHTPRSLAGVSAKNDYDVNSLCVPRKAGEAIGGIARLRSERSGSSMTINVEYNQLDPLLRATVSPEGDVNDDSGWSPYPGERCCCKQKQT